MSESRENNTILFICTGNAGRSQMAEAMLRNMADEDIDVFSAGVEPWKDLHPMARKLMAEKGIDLSAHYPKHVNEFIDMDWDIVVMIGDRAENESPDFIVGHSRIYWDIDDPADADGRSDSEYVFRYTCDQISKRLGALLPTLKSAACRSEVFWKPAISTVCTKPSPFEPAKDIPEFVKAGFSIIELCCYEDYMFRWRDSSSIKNLRSIADNHGVKIWSVHPPDEGNICSLDTKSRKTQVSILKQFVDIAEELGSVDVVFHAGIGLAEGPGRSESVKVMRTCLQELAEYTRSRAVTMCLETVPERADQLTNIQIIEEAKAASQSAFGVVIDTGHSHIANNLCGTAKIVGRRLVSLHLHDNDGKSDQHQQLWNGTIDWKAFVHDLEVSDYRGPLMFEVACGGSLQQTVREAQKSANRLIRYNSTLENKLK